jgi:PAS domain S-box-containing protein
VSDLEGKILQANDAVSHLLGFRQDEVVEQSVSRFLGADETREFVAALTEVVEHGVSRNVPLHPRSASGEVISTTLNASALRDADGNVIGAIGILRDMRAYEQVLHDLEDSRRELRDADEAKDRFLAVVSHELRTPLTAMLGWVRLLTAGMLDDATSARALPVIERNTKLLAQLIDDLLDVSRIVAGKLRLEVGPVASSPSSSRRSRPCRVLRTRRASASKPCSIRRPGLSRATPLASSRWCGTSSQMRSSSPPAEDASTTSVWNELAGRHASPFAIPVRASAGSFYR